jgi:adenosine deaminase
MHASLPPGGGAEGAGDQVWSAREDGRVAGIGALRELALAAGHLRWDLAELVESQRRAVRASFAPEERKAELLGLLDAYAAARGA